MPTYAARCSPVRVERAATRSAGVPSKTIRPPSWPGAGAEVDHPVGVSHDRLVVPDDDDRLAGVDEPVFDMDKPISKFTKKQLHDLLYREPTRARPARGSDRGCRHRVVPMPAPYSSWGPYVESSSTLAPGMRTRPVQCSQPRCPRLPALLRRRVEVHGGTNQRLQRPFVDLVVLMDVDGTPGVALEAGVEEARRVLQ